MALRRRSKVRFTHSNGGSSIRAAIFATLLAGAVTSIAAEAGAQAPPIIPPPAPGPAKQPVKPPTKSTDLEIDPDKPKEAPPLPPPDPGGWGIGGKEEEGKFAPGAKKQEAPKEVDDGKPIDIGRPGEAGLDTVIGFGSIRDVTNELVSTNAGNTDATVASFVFFFRYRLGDMWTLQARFPFSRASIAGPLGGASGAKDDYNQFSVGNLELALNPAFAVKKHLRLLPQVAFYIPTATGDLFAAGNDRGAISQALINQAAGASRGWAENPLFASKRMGLRFGFGVRYDTTALHFEAGTRFDLMGKISGESAVIKDGGTIVPHIRTPNWAWVTGASFFYDFLEGKVSPGLGTWLAVTKAPVVEGTRDYGGAQFVIEPGVRTKWPINEAKTMGINGGIGFILPLGGHLGGADDASIKGFRIDASFYF